MKKTLTVFDNVKTNVKALIHFKDTIAKAIIHKIAFAQQYVFNIFTYACLMSILASSSWALFLGILFKLLENVHLTTLTSLGLLLILNMLIFVKIYFKLKRHLLQFNFNSSKKHRARS